MKKVCIITTVHRADDIRIYHKEVCSLAEKYDLTYIAPGANSIEDANIKCVNYSKSQNLVKRVFGFFAVWNLCRLQKCDLYHIQDPEIIPAGFLLKLLSRKKVIYDVHEDYPDSIRQKEHLKKPIRELLAISTKFVEWIAGKVFDFIIVADGSVYKRFPSKKTEIIYNFPDISLISLQKEPQEKIYDIVFPGSISKKMMLIMFDITKEIISKRTNFKLLLINGGSTWKDETKQWIREEMEKRKVGSETIELMERITHKEVCSFIEKSKVGIIPFPDTPKFRKNIPTKLFEYLYCRVPVVASDLPPIRQFVESEDCCILIDISDTINVSSAILELITDGERRKKMGENGHRLVVDRLNWSNEKRKLLSIYEGVFCL